MIKIKNSANHFRDFFSINGDFLWNSVLDTFPEYEFSLNELKDELYVQLELLSARNFLSTQEFIYFVNQEDQMLKKAVKLLKSENYEF